MSRVWKQRNEIISCIILRYNSKGYVAEMRFSNPKFDRNISYMHRKDLYDAIERYVGYATR